MIRIALSGKMGSGKSTVARYLVETYNFVEMSFATPLKEIADEIFGAGSVKNRRVLQGLGVYIRELDKNAWIRYLIARLPSDKSVVVSDLRFENEANALGELGFSLVRIEVSEETQKRRLVALYDMYDEDTLTHISEVELDDYEFDFVLNGDQPRTHLLEDVDEMIADLLYAGDAADDNNG